MTGPLANLFRPIRVGPFTLKNRIAVSPHGPMMADGGLLTRQYVDYEIEKAKGGAGLIIMSFGIADPQAPDLMSTYRALVHTWRRENIPYFKEIVDAAHGYDCRVFFQFGENPFGTHIAASAIPHTGSSGYSREMTHGDIRRMMDNYARCAEPLAEAGLDGVEMHGHGDFFSDFFSPSINRRQDNYGGSIENRMRFFFEAADVIRGVIGCDKVLGARVSVDDNLPGSLPLADGVNIARLMAESGKLDYLNIDTAVEPQVLPRIIAPMYAEQGYELYAAEAVKKVVRDLPIFTIGRIVDPDFADAIIGDGRADVVAMARALIADPELPNKAKDGRLDDIRPCLGDNQECMGRILQGIPLGCTVNPTAGRETEWGIGKLQRAARPRKVLVIGGGPAGMEAARVAALRGHDVHLVEKTDSLGGQVLLAERLPGRADIGRFLPWHRGQLEKLGVTVRLGTEATVETIERVAPDAVVLATGAEWQKSGFNSMDFQETPGWDQAHVLSLTDVVSGRVEAGRRVVVFDLKGFVEAPGVAELLAAGGRQVEIVTPFAKLGVSELDLTLQWPYLMSRLLAAGVVITPDTMAEAIEPKAVKVVNLYSRESRTIPADHVVIISGRLPNDELHDALASRSLELHRVGDCASPRNIGKAFREGYEAGLAL
jgi:2,4-dienoyl-CoA reductase-like NADH-dependent reductase (Old Yellow Enzyme family)/thioredoxin reductase